MNLKKYTCLHKSQQSAVLIITASSEDWAEAIISGIVADSGAWVIDSVEELNDNSE